MYKLVIKLYALLLLVVVIGSCSGTNEMYLTETCKTDGSPFGGGTGDSELPYYICTAEHLNQIRNYLTSTFLLRADIDLAGSGLTPITIDTDNSDTDCDGDAFSGTFYGNNHTLSNWTYTSVNDNCVGLFGYAVGATIQDLTLSNFILDYSPNTFNHGGTLIGYGANVTLSNITISGGNATFDFYRAGGLIGSLISASTLNSSSSSINISTGFGSVAIGGLVGETNVASISSSSFTGTITGNGNIIGGFIGNTLGNGSMTNSYSTGDITGIQIIGGLIGNIGSDFTLTYSYATGNVTGTTNVAGLIGIFTGSAATSSDCYATGDVNGSVNNAGGLFGSFSSGTFNRIYNVTNSITSGGVNLGGIVGQQTGGTITDAYHANNLDGLPHRCLGGCTDSTSAAMLLESTFSGWDFTSIWILNSSSYPTLR